MKAACILPFLSVFATRSTPGNPIVSPNSPEGSPPPLEGTNLIPGYKLQPRVIFDHLVVLATDVFVSQATPLPSEAVSITLCFVSSQEKGKQGRQI